MLGLAAVASVVTLYCDVTFSSNNEPPRPADQRVFTVNLDTNQIFVVAGSRRGRVLQAKAVTEGAIEFPDYGTLDFFTSNSGVEGGGVERIDRSTGAYEARTFMRMGPMGTRTFVYQGRCAPGALVPFPERQF